MLNARDMFIKKIKRFTFVKSSKNLDPDKFDVVNERKGMYLVSLIGSDRNNDHCVALYDDLIFDSNEDFALKRNINNLNYCCSSIETSSKFVKCCNVTFFEIVLKKRKKKNKK